MTWGRKKLCCIREEEMELRNRTSLFMFLRLNTWPVFSSFCGKYKYCLWAIEGGWERSSLDSETVVGVEKTSGADQTFQFLFQFNFYWKKTLHFAIHFSNPEQLIFLIMVYQCDCILLASFTWYHEFSELHFLSDCLTPHYVLGSNCAPEHWCKVLFWISCHVLNFHKDVWADVLDVTIWWYNYKAENSF